MLLDNGSEKFVAAVEKIDRVVLIGTHQYGETHHISDHDGGKATISHTGTLVGTQITIMAPSSKYCQMPGSLIISASYY
jgi:hypothetical protein